MYSTNSTDTVPVLHYGIPLEGINPPVTVYIHRALRTIGQHSIEGNIVIMIIYSYQLLGTTLVHPLASTGAIPVPSTGATSVAVGMLMCSLKIIYILLGSTEEAIDATVACKVLSENISTIIRSQINFPSFLDKLLAKEVISDVDKRKIMDSKTTLSIDERWRELLDLVQATIELDEEVFLIFLDAIKGGGTRREKMLADKLYKVVNMLYIVSI